MLRQLAAAVIGLTLVAQPALAKGFDDRVLFHRLFDQDIEAGHYQIGEDEQITSRLRARESVLAEFRIVEARRAEKFGSGIAFYVLDSKRQRYLRIAFSDVAGDAAITFDVRRSVDSDALPDDKVARKLLSIRKGAVGRVAIRINEQGHVLVAVDGEKLEVPIGFKADSLQVQVYCAKGWARFLDGDLTS